MTYIQDNIFNFCFDLKSDLWLYGVLKLFIIYFYSIWKTDFFKSTVTNLRRGNDYSSLIFFSPK